MLRPADKSSERRNDGKTHDFEYMCVMCYVTDVDESKSGPVLHGASSNTA